MAKSSMSGFGCGALFLLPFMVIGAGVFGFLGVRPLWQSLASQRWLEVPCTIDQAEVQSSRDSDGDQTFRIIVSYTYRVDGREYHSDRHGFETGGSNIAVEAKRARVQEFTSRPQQRCWVDPRDATSAVLDRGVPGVVWIGLIFGALFGGVPLAIFIVMVRSWRRAKRRAAMGESEPLSESARDKRTEVPVAEVVTGPHKLEGDKNQGCGVLFLFLFAAVWNGITWYAFLTARHEWGLRLFLIIFLVIGAIVVLVAIYQFLSLFNPVPELELDRGGLRPGDAAELRWTWQGNHRRILGLKIELIGREEASYRRGTNTITDKHDLSRTVVYESLETDADGRVRFKIPDNALPTLTSPNNKVQWIIKVHGDIPRFPDVNREFPITVLPPANGVVTIEARSNSDGPIRMAHGCTAFRPGDAVTGKIHWSLPESRTRLELRLFWYTAGKGTVDTTLMDALTIDQPGLSGEHDFALRLPASGPVSCSGQLVSVLWALELVAEPGGAIGHVDLVVGPTGVELRA